MLIDLLPENYKKSPEVVKIQGALDPSVDSLQAARDSLFDQLFVNTATWGLTLWEKTYGITADMSTSYTFRRERIRAKIRGTGTTTKQMIRDVAAAFSGGDVEVIEHNEENRFVVKFVGKLGVPPNMADLTLSIEEIKPAHLAFTFEYTYHVWAEVTGYLWDQVNGGTWYQLSVI